MLRCALLFVLVVLISVQAVCAQSRPQLSRQQIIESADENKDGRIDRAEFLHRMQEAFFFVDTNKDGYVTLEEYQQAIQGAAPQRFTRADRNQDGKVSMEEFLKAVNADVDAADKNGDGVLDTTEIEMWLSR
jgi:Ca2+-binding EF-hand superfamily protein